MAKRGVIFKKNHTTAAIHKIVLVTNTDLMCRSKPKCWYSWVSFTRVVQRKILSATFLTPPGQQRNKLD